MFSMELLGIKEIHDYLKSAHDSWRRPMTGRLGNPLSYASLIELGDSGRFPAGMLTVNMHSLPPGIFNNLASLDDWLTQKRFEPILKSGLGDLKSRVQADTPVKTGALRNAWTVEIE